MNGEINEGIEVIYKSLKQKTFFSISESIDTLSEKKYGHII